jgi:hypothetical protein
MREVIPHPARLTFPLLEITNGVNFHACTVQKV